MAESASPYCDSELITVASPRGARRWLDFGIRFQPSEFLKPAFAVTTAWILSWRSRDPELPVIPLSGVFVGLVVVLLMVQPNLGDAILFVGAWFVLGGEGGFPIGPSRMPGRRLR